MFTATFRGGRRQGQIYQMSEPLSHLQMPYQTDNPEVSFSIEIYRLEEVEHDPATRSITRVVYEYQSG